MTRALVDPNDPGFVKPTKPIGRFLPRRRGARCSSTTARPGRTAARRGGAAWSPRRSRSTSSTRRRCCELIRAGFVVVANGGGGIPVVRRADGSLSGVEAVIDKDLGAALLGVLVGADVLVVATDVPQAVLALRHSGGRADRTGHAVADAGVRRGGPLRERLDGAEGRRRLPVRAGHRPARRDHQPRPASSRP